MIPKLGGGAYEDINSEVENLAIVYGEALPAYIARATYVQTTIEDSGVSLSP